MIPRVFFFPLLLGASLLIPGSVYGQVQILTTTTCPKADDQVGLGDDNAEHRSKSCDSDGPEDTRLKNFQTWMEENGQPEHADKDKVKKPKYRIRDFDECLTGNENKSSCYVNPDIQPCSDGSLPITRQIYTIQNVLVQQFKYCPGDPPPSDLPQDLFIEQIRIDIEKFRSFPIKGSSIQSAPNKFSLRNGHTHFWASEDTQEFRSNLSGSDVRIKAIPIQWNWNYGDGATRNLSFPGEAMPSHTLHDETPTSHSYSETGKFGVKVTTLYRGEFSVDGGPWQAIPGQAAVPSNTLPIDVWRTEKELIAND